MPRVTCVPRFYTEANNRASSVGSQHKRADMDHRRFSFGVQAKNLFLHTGFPSSIEEHVRKAVKSPHPIADTPFNLEPEWEEIFQQWERALATQALPRVCEEFKVFRERGFGVDLA